MSTNSEKNNFSKFLLLWSGELISAIGGGLTSFGLSVYIFQQTGSAAGMALVALLGFLPTLILSVPAGVLADRYDRRLLMIIGDGCSALGIIYILICMLRGNASLTSICIGVFISAVFSALLEPAYKATVSDLLSKDEFTKASGLVSLAGSTRYLISPMIAGLLLSVSDVKLLLIIDISTFFLTVLCTIIVRRGIEVKRASTHQTFLQGFQEGWHAVHAKKGILQLIMVSAVMTLFMGMFQILAEPLILAFSDSKTLGIAETICASGMLFSSLILGMKGLKGNHVRILRAALSMAGVFMIGFGIWERIYVICIFGFLFFAILPLANSSLDYLVRTNIPDELQGRAWGFIGLISQLGYVIAYGFGGLLADAIGNLLQKGVGRGAGLVIIFSGVCMIITAIWMGRVKSIQNLEIEQNENKKQENKMKKEPGKDRFSTICFTAFVTMVITMISLTMLLFINLTGAIDHLMETAKTPSFLQMHTGEIDVPKLDNFAQSRDEVTDTQIAEFLNIDNSIIKLGERSLIDSTQDNGLSVQGDGFDFMLDLMNKIPDVQSGQVYVPVCYQSLYQVRVGDIMEIGEESLQIAGFIRDSQMNSMMASSKRFLVSEEDYDRLYYLGSEEFIIEYLLREGADTNAFKTAYENANLPMNGPTITKPLIKMINVLSDGIMIGIILLVSILIFLISMVCIRFVLLTRIAAEANEVGILKAIGISRKDIKQIFFRKYQKLIFIGAAIGIMLSGLLFRPLAAQMQTLYGVAANGFTMILFAVLGAIVVGSIILLFVNRILKKLNEMTAIKALTQQETTEKKNHNKVCIILVTCIAVFLMLIPTNLYSTMSSPDFVTYMGIGGGQIRMDIRDSTHMQEDLEDTRKLLAQDKDVREYTLYQTSSMSVELTDGTRMNLLMELGNHMLFPVTYCEGEAPSAEREMALSYILSNELELKVGDTLLVKTGKEYEPCKISGIYSDVTNGGKTAKLFTQQLNTQENVIWSIIYLSLYDNVDQKSFIEKYSAENVEVVDIASRVTSVYGPTLNQIRMAAFVIKIIAAVIILLVILMFVRLMIANDRNQISVQKAIGISSAQVKKEYWKMCVPYMIIGVLSGLILGNTLGEKICGIALQSLGAAQFAFTLNIWTVIINLAVGSLAAVLAVYMAVRDISSIKAVECCRGRE